MHLQHGPIDLIIKAEGRPEAVREAYRKAEDRFRTVLDELVSELSLLRQPTDSALEPVTPVARRMWRATALFPGEFITPMSAVAGSVADEILDVLIERTTGLCKVFVNNGGDIALWKADHEEFNIDLASYPDPLNSGDRRPVTIQIRGKDRIGGVATSGRHGRSLSLGIADAVTVLAGNAAIADACATLIANSVDIESPRVTRLPANEIELDTDLGERLVPVNVGQLGRNECDSALEKGVKLAQEFHGRDLVNNVLILLQGDYRCVGEPANPDHMGRISL